MKQTIRLGITLQGENTTIGAILTVLGVILLFFHYLFPFGIVLVLIGIPMFLSFRGVDLDYTNKTMRQWFSLYGWKIGETESFALYQKVELKQYSSSQRMNMASISQNVSTKTFELWFAGLSGCKLHIADIPKYSEAKRLLAEISEQAGLEKYDYYAAMLEKVREIREQNPNRRR